MNDLYQEATDKIIKALESGTIPWEQPWTNVDAGPLRNPVSNNNYRGINCLLLFCASMDRKLHDSRWVSYKQAAANGWQVKKGAKAEKVYFYKPILVDEKDEAGRPIIDDKTGKPKQKEIPFLQATPVFNAEEIIGMPKAEPTTFDFTPIEAGEEIVKRSPVPINYGGNRAYYDPNRDEITMPDKGQFKDSSKFYGVLAHEIVHSSGHQSRLAREFGKTHGDENYAKEELCAQIGSFMLSLETGLPSQVEHDAAYLASWLRALKDDKRFLFQASSKAAAAVDFVMGRHLLCKKADVRAAVEPDKPQTPPAQPVAQPASEGKSKLQRRREAQQKTPEEPKRKLAMR